MLKVIILISSLISTIWGANTTECQNTYKDYLPIVAWGLKMTDKYPDDKELSDVKECGFNTVLHYNVNLNADSICKKLNNYGLKIIMGSYDLKTKKAERFIKSLSDNKNILCWFLEDEPHFDKLLELRNQYVELQKKCIDKPIYINLIGKLSKKFTGNCSSMQEYLDTIQNMFNPQIWSYDYYPISVVNGKYCVDYDQFFLDLKLFQDRSQSTGRPFWAYCQGMQYKSVTVERPAATLPFLRFEAFSALAFGAKAIVYWGYKQTKSKYQQNISALIDSMGGRTAAWYDAQKVNREISIFSDIFINSKNHKIHIYNNNLLNDSINRLFQTHIDSIIGIYSTGKGILLSDFISNNDNYILILNLDVEQSQNIRFSLRHDLNYKIIEYGKSNKKKISTINSREYAKELSPGGYLILSYE